MEILRWVGALLVLTVVAYRGLVQGGVFASRSSIGSRPLVSVSLANVLILGWAIALAFITIDGAGQIYPSPWFALVYSVAFLVAGVLGWKESRKAGQ